MSNKSRKDQSLAPSMATKSKALSSWRKRGLVVALFAILTSCAGGATESPPSPEYIPPPTTISSFEENNQPIALRGVVLPYKTSTLSFGQSGVINEISVYSGQRVEAGQILARLDSTSVQEAIDRAQARLELVTAELLLLETNPSEEEVEVAQAVVNVSKARLEEIRLRGAMSIAGKAEVTLAEARLNALLAGRSEEELTYSRLLVAESELLLEQAKMAVERLILRAPFSGVISFVGTEEGGFVSSTTPMFILWDPYLWIVQSSQLDDFQLSRLGEGQPALVVVGAFPDRIFTGIVTTIMPLVRTEESGGNHLITIELMDLDDSLRWGMEAIIKISADT